RQEQAGPADALGVAGLPAGLDVFEEDLPGPPVFLQLAEEEAELGVAVPGVECEGPAVEALPPSELDLIPPARPDAEDSPPSHGLWRRRGHRHRLPKLGKGLVGPSRLGEGVAEERVRAAVLGIEPDRLAVGRDRLVEPSEAHQAYADVLVD